MDPEVILQTSHGRRSIDMLKVLSPEKANWECESELYKFQGVASGRFEKKKKKKPRSLFVLLLNIAP